MDAFKKLDIYPKTLDDLKERTLGGGCISLCFALLALLLFNSELRQYLAVETVDRLDVDTSSIAAGSRLPVNVDIYLPSLPCSELITDVVDESGLQQLSVTDTLSKLRMDRHGTPIDIPQAVVWGETLAPAFKQRKVLALMEEANQHLHETVDHLAHEEDENPDLSPEEHAQHRAELAEQAALLQSRLERLTTAAAEGEPMGVEEEVVLSAREVKAMHKAVQASRVYSEAQREEVIRNLHAMHRNLNRLPEANGTIAENLHEALRIRLTILNDNVQGFVSSKDVDRRDKYTAIEELLKDVRNVSDTLHGGMSTRAAEVVEKLQESLAELSTGARNQQRAVAESTMKAQLQLLQAELRGEAELPKSYCGSCYGASVDPHKCCNTCDEVKAAYRERKWGLPDVKTIEQCTRDARRKAASVEEGEGCNIFGTMKVARVTSSFNIAPASKATASRIGALLLQPPKLAPREVGHFNVTHQIRRLSFGHDFPGQTNPLDQSWTHSPSGAAISRYFLKVVPTTYAFLDGQTVHTNQFSVTQYFKALDEHSSMLPSLSFTFELTPLRVEKTERRGGSLLGFFTRCAALIGGLFTVAGILDSAVYASSKHIVKMQLNKAA